MKVLFCFPPPEDDIRIPKGGPTQEVYGVGIGYLQAYLENMGIKPIHTRTISLYGLNIVLFF